MTSREASGAQTNSASGGTQFFTILGTVLALVSIAGTFLLFVNPRFDDINQSIGALDTRITSVESRMVDLETGLAALDNKLDAIGGMIMVANQDGELVADEIRAIWQQVSD